MSPIAEIQTIACMREELQATLQSFPKDQRFRLLPIQSAAARDSVLVGCGLTESSPGDDNPIDTDALDPGELRGIVERGRLED